MKRWFDRSDQELMSKNKARSTTHAVNWSSSQHIVCLGSCFFNQILESDEYFLFEAAKDANLAILYRTATPSRQNVAMFNNLIRSYTLLTLSLSLLIIERIVKIDNIIIMLTYYFCNQLS